MDCVFFVSHNFIITMRIFVYTTIIYLQVCRTEWLISTKPMLIHVPRSGNILPGIDFLYTLVIIYILLLCNMNSKLVLFVIIMSYLRHM